MKLTLAALILSLVASSPQPVAAQECKQEPQATVSVKFTGSSSSPEDVISFFNAKVEEATVHAKSIGILDLTAGSRKYSILPKGEGDAMTYAYDGSIAFDAVPYQQGVELMELLAGRGYATDVEVYTDCF